MHTTECIHGNRVSSIANVSFQNKMTYCKIFTAIIKCDYNISKVLPFLLGFGISASRAQL